MTTEERHRRAQCPFVELVGGEGYVCNKENYPDPSIHSMFGGILQYHAEKHRKKCFGCNLIFDKKK